jgi:sulfonate transport system ATP-binding protein
LSRVSASIRQTVIVPGERPRDRGSAELAELRGRLLDGLGVDRHHRARTHETSTNHETATNHESRA